MTAIVLDRVKYPHNLAATIRAAACFGVERVLWCGQRFAFADGERLPREERMKGYRSVEVVETARPFDQLDRSWRVICVELTPTATALVDFWHPLGNCAYVFGPEDGGVSKAFRGLCHQHVYIPARHCLNLAAAVNVVLAHRSFQRDDRFKPSETEGRGLIDVAGWDGK